MKREQAEPAAATENLGNERTLRAEAGDNHAASFSQCLLQVEEQKRAADASRSSVEDGRDSTLMRVVDLEKLLKNVRGDA